MNRFLPFPAALLLAPLAALHAAAAPPTPPNIIFCLVHDIGEAHNFAKENPAKAKALAKLLSERLRAANAQVLVDKATGQPVELQDEFRARRQPSPNPMNPRLDKPTPTWMKYRMTYLPLATCVIAMTTPVFPKARFPISDPRQKKYPWRGADARYRKCA